MTTNTVDNNKSMEKYFFRASAQDFNKISGSPVAYWATGNIFKCFDKHPAFKCILNPKQGTSTGDDEVYVRSWFEIDFFLLGLKIKSLKEALNSVYIYFPLNKGGEFRKWYGNNEKIIKLGDGAYNDLIIMGNKLPSRDLYFKRGVTWSKITSYKISVRYDDFGFVFSSVGLRGLPDESNLFDCLGYMNSLLVEEFTKILSPTLSIITGDIEKLPYKQLGGNAIKSHVTQLISLSKTDWDSYETSWNFTTLPLLHSDYGHKLQGSYEQLRAQWQENTLEMQRLEEENNRIFIEAYGLQDELTPEVPLNEITLTCNPHYRYRLGKQWDDASEVERNAELERQLQSDTICELISYIIGCMMGRYSIDQPGLILASQGETLQDYLQRVPNPRFIPDDDAIVPLTDQEWFEDDATHRVREFVRTVWGEQHLQENLDFIAESLCLSAMRPRKGESSLDCIRRYLSTQFYKDHMRTYKKRPIYWLFSSGRLKAFECLVYLHRYNEGTLARMRTEYVIPLTAKLHSYTERLENEKANSTSTADTRRLEKEIDQLHKQQAELAAFDEQLRDYADQRIQLDLDDGVKVNYGKFGNLLADVKAIAGSTSDD